MSYQTDPAYLKAKATMALANQSGNAWVQNVNDPRWNGNQWAGGQWINLKNALDAIETNRADYVDAAGNLTASAVQEMNDRADFLNGQMAAGPVAPAPPVTPSGSSDTDFVISVYQHYYHRDPRNGDAAGLAYWVNELTSARKTRADIEHVFLTTPDNWGNGAPPAATPPASTPPATTPPASDIPIIGPFIDEIGGLPIVGPVVDAVSGWTGIGRGGVVLGLVAVVGVGLAVAMGGDGSGTRRR
jgi:hypothetical protein